MLDDLLPVIEPEQAAECLSDPRSLAWVVGEPLLQRLLDPSLTPLACVGGSDSKRPADELGERAQTVALAERQRAPPVPSDRQVTRVALL